MYCECVFVAVGTQREMNLRHIVICGPSCSTILFHKSKIFVKLLNMKCVF